MAQEKQFYATEEIFWAQEGTETGRELGRQASTAKGFRWLIKKNIIKTPMESDIRSLAWPYFDREEQIIEKEVLKDHFRWYGWWLGYETGYVEGRQTSNY